MPSDQLTSEELAEKEALKKLFNNWQESQKRQGKKMPQEKVADLLGFSQGALSHYLVGRNPLNLDAAIKFAKLIGCKVEDFSPSLVKQAKYYAYEAGIVDDASGLSPCALRIAKFFDALPEYDQDVLITVATAMVSKREATPNFRVVKIDDDLPKNLSSSANYQNRLQK